MPRENKPELAFKQHDTQKGAARRPANTRKRRAGTNAGKPRRAVSRRSSG